MDGILYLVFTGTLNKNQNKKQKTLFRQICFEGHCLASGGSVEFEAPPSFSSSSRLRRVMVNSDPRDRFVDPFLKLMLYSLSCILLGASA